MQYHAPECPVVLEFDRGEKDRGDDSADEEREQKDEKDHRRGLDERGKGLEEGLHY